MDKRVLDVQITRISSEIYQFLTAFDRISKYY